MRSIVNELDNCSLESDGLLPDVGVSNLTLSNWIAEREACLSKRLVKCCKLNCEQWGRLAALQRLNVELGTDAGADLDTNIRLGGGVGANTRRSYDDSQFSMIEG